MIPLKQLPFSFGFVTEVVQADVIEFADSPNALMTSADPRSTRLLVWVGDFWEGHAFRRREKTDDVPILGLIVLRDQIGLPFGIAAQSETVSLGGLLTNEERGRKFKLLLFGSQHGFILVTVGPQGRLWNGRDTTPVVIEFLDTLIEMNRKLRSDRLKT